jgi:hypothetical protein
MTHQKKAVYISLHTAERNTNAIAEHLDPTPRRDITWTTGQAEAVHVTGLWTARLGGALIDPNDLTDEQLLALQTEGIDLGTLSPPLTRWAADRT